ncbi:MAG TPA: type II toxin-antitoxin system HicB family antitoxin [Thermoanaerobaculia bacterium]|jgi:predicted RNase H-like HicB family nuclease
MADPKTAQDYLQLPYSRVLVPQAGGGFSARILEFPGCIAEATTCEETLTALEQVAESWLEVAIALGHKIAEPLAAHQYSGKIAVRLPPWLHEQLVRIAETSHLTVNQFIVAAIGEKVGQHAAAAEIIPPIREIVGDSIRQEAVAQILPIRDIVDESIRQVAVAHILPPIRTIVDESIREVAVAQILAPIRELVSESLRQAAEIYARNAAPGAQQ